MNEINPPPSLWNWIRSKLSWFWALGVWVRWTVLVCIAAVNTLWFAYIEGQNTNVRLSTDYAQVQTSQSNLLDRTQRLITDLQNPHVQIDLLYEFDQLRAEASATITALSALRAPTQDIDTARKEYRVALERVLGVTNRIAREGVDGMAAPLHSTLQDVANEGGDFNSVIQNFQGGMWPQLRGAIL